MRRFSPRGRLPWSLKIAVTTFQLSPSCARTHAHMHTRAHTHIHTRRVAHTCLCFIITTRAASPRLHFESENKPGLGGPGERGREGALRLPLAWAHGGLKSAQHFMVAEGGEHFPKGETDKDVGGLRDHRGQVPPLLPAVCVGASAQVTQRPPFLVALSASVDGD